MRTTGQACADLAAALRAHGFRADTDPAALTVDPVAVWVQPRELRDWTLGGGARLLVWLYVITRNTEYPDVIRLLDDALTGLLELVDPADSDPAVDLAAALALPSAPTTVLPAYRLAVDLDL